MKRLRKGTILAIIFAVMCSALACSKSKAPEVEEPESIVSVVPEETPEAEETKAQDEIRIVITWNGTGDDGNTMSILAELTDPHNVADYRDVISEETDDGSIELIITDFNKDYNFHAMINDNPDFEGNINNSNISAEVYLPGAEEAVVYHLRDGGDDVFKSYTGTRLWGPFGISKGELVEYDPSWMNLFSDEDETEETEESKESEESEEMEISEAVGETETYAPFIFGTLLGETETGSDVYVEEVHEEDGYLLVTGCLKGVDTEEELFGETAYLYEYGTYSFIITEETEFYAVGGTAGPQEMTLDEFLELAHYYNGLGLIMEIDGDVLVCARISS